MRVAAETRIQALEGELKTAQGTLSRIEANLNVARARIRATKTEETTVDLRLQPEPGLPK